MLHLPPQRPLSFALASPLKLGDGAKLREGLGLVSNRSVGFGRDRLGRLPLSMLAEETDSMYDMTGA